MNSEEERKAKSLRAFKDWIKIRARIEKRTPPRSNQGNPIYAGPGEGKEVVPYSVIQQKRIDKINKDYSYLVAIKYTAHVLADKTMLGGGEQTKFAGETLNYKGQMKDQLNTSQEENSETSEEEKLLSAEEMRAEARRIYKEVLEESRRMVEEEKSKE